MARSTQESHGGPRMLAARVLHRVVEEDAYVALALDAALGRAGTLAAPDRGLATELVYGTLRHLARLDAALGQACTRPLKKVDALLLCHARVGAYEMLALGTPDHAAVNEAVTAARRSRGPGAGGFLNGVLRGLARLRDSGALAPSPSDDTAAVVARTGVPAWLVEDVRARLGPAEAAAFAAQSLERPRVHLCVPRPGDRDATAALLVGAGVEAEAHPWCATGVVLEPGSGSWEKLEGIVGTRALVQNVSSQCVAGWAARVAGTGAVLDLCAAPGGKSSVLRAAGADVTAVDVHVDKLHLARKQWARLGLAVRAVAADGTRPPFADGAFPVVLLDAPCTGSGLLARRPEMKLRRGEDVLARLVALQRGLLDAAAGLVSPGGSLLYSVCSVSNAEGPAQVDAFLARHPSFRRAACALPVPEDALEEGALALWPHRHGVDGFYAARLQRGI
ncbi:MAG: methyltransferase domain-containing protein [Deltaproteobacteria bacterium]|nr:methyltransferase domain-containing protein [Deltaproteobacteria bacterium]